MATEYGGKGGSGGMKGAERPGGAEHATGGGKGSNYGIGGKKRRGALEGGMSTTERRKHISERLKKRKRH